VPLAGAWEGTFSQLYEKDVVDEDAFMGWKDDVANKTPGKQTAIMNTLRWFEWLSTADEPEEDDDEDDSSVEEALKDVVRPNNSTRLR
jgi:hypothetical protein